MRSCDFTVPLPTVHDIWHYTQDAPDGAKDNDGSLKDPGDFPGLDVTLPYKDSSSDCYSSCHYEKKTGILECTEIDDNSKTPCFPPGKLQCTPPSTDVTKDRFDCAYTNTTGKIYTPWAWCNVVTRPVSSPVSPTVSPQYLTKDAKKLSDYEFAMYTLRQCMNDKEACVVNGYTLAANLIPQHAHFLGCYFDWVLPELWAIEELKPNNFVKDFANLVGATNWTYPRDLPVYDANLQCKSTCSFKMTKGSSPPTANLNCCALQDEQSSQDGLRVKSCFLEGQMKCHYVEQDASSRMCPSTHPKYKYVEGWSDVLQPQFYCRTSPSPGPNICEVPEVSKEYWDGYIEVWGVHFRVDMKGLDFGSKGETFRKLLQKYCLVDKVGWKFERLETNNRDPSASEWRAFGNVLEEMIVCLGEVLFGLGVEVDQCNKNIDEK